MLGLMQDRPLLISTLIEHAARYHAEVEIVSRTCEGPTVRTSWRTMSKRVAQLANALKRMGVKPGDRVAVRRQGFWDNRRRELTEALVHQVCHIRPLHLDEASGAV